MENIPLTKTMTKTMIGRRPLATNPMDRTGSHVFVFVDIFAKLPTFSLLTSCSAEPKVFVFTFVCLSVGLFVRLSAAARFEPRQALMAPLASVLL